MGGLALAQVSTADSSAAFEGRSVASSHFNYKKGLLAVNITKHKERFSSCIQEFEISLFLPSRSPHASDGIRTRKQLRRLLPSVRQQICPVTLLQLRDCTSILSLWSRSELDPCLFYRCDTQE